MLAGMGSGASGMFETVMVTILVSAMCALIRAHGGFEALLAFIRRVFRGRVGGRLGVGLLVGAMDIATANNTVAIVMAGPIAKETARSTASPPGSPPPCWTPSPASSRASSPMAPRCSSPCPPPWTLGGDVTAFQVIPCLFYPYLLAVSSVVFSWSGPGAPAAVSAAGGGAARSRASFFVNFAHVTFPAFLRPPSVVN